jgi:hypothetical protein
VFAFARRDYDAIVSNMRPTQAQQIAQTKPSMRSQINCLGNLGRAGTLELRYIGLGPYDLGPVLRIAALCPHKGLRQFCRARNFMTSVSNPYGQYVVSTKENIL